MSILGKLLKTTIDIATLPIDIVADIVTLGGAINDKDSTYTSKKIDKLSDDVDEIEDELDDL